MLFTRSQRRRPESGLIDKIEQSPGESLQKKLSGVTT
jgi:hypothetical protein